MKCKDGLFIEINDVSILYKKVYVDVEVKSVFFGMNKLKFLNRFDRLFLCIKVIFYNI